jgi:hypothetical protein
MVISILISLLQRVVKRPDLLSGLSLFLRTFFFTVPRPACSACR